MLGISPLDFPTLMADEKAFFKALGQRGRTPLLQKQIEWRHQLPKTQQKVLMQVLDGVLAQTSR